MRLVELEAIAEAATSCTKERQGLADEVGVARAARVELDGGLKTMQVAHARAQVAQGHAEAQQDLVQARRSHLDKMEAHGTP